MTPPTPDEMITDCAKQIEQFLRDGMQQHAIDELKSVISDINRFHKKRRVADEISDIDEVINALEQMQRKYADDKNSHFTTTLDILEARRCVLFEELEALK